MTLARFSASVEDAVDASLVRILNEDRTLGTGFIVTPDGWVVTCHHVISNRKSFQVKLHLESEDVLPLTIDGGLVESFPNFDLAIFKIGDTKLEPLPALTSCEALDRFFTKGFQYQTRGLTAAVPVRGKVGGKTRIRYTRSDLVYDVEVLTLEGGDIDAGISGGPAVDPGSGAAFGVVVARLPDGKAIHGFALSFASIIKAVPRLAEILMLNEKRVARFGKRPNRLGAEALCRAQVTKMIERLRREKLYLPERFLERGTLSSRFAEFDQGTRKVLPVLGYAGMGKTSWLTRLADELLGTRPALLVRGLAIQRADGGLGQLLDAALDGIDEMAWRDQPDAEGILLAFSDEGTGLLVLMDGLNEARTKPHEVADVWIPDTVTWIQKRRVRLVLTCRTEPWQLLSNRFPADLVAIQERGDKSNPSDVEPTGMMVTLFTEDEAQKAATLYGVPMSDKPGILRHPLTLRLLGEVVRNQPPTVSSTSAIAIDAVIERLIDRICSRVALECYVVVERIRALIMDLANHLFSTGIQEVGFPFVGEKLSHAQSWLDALTREHLLVATKTGYRFAFDDISEYLQSALVDTSRLADPEYLAEFQSRAQSGLLAHAYGRMASAGRIVEINRLVVGLARHIPLNRHDVYLAFDISRRLSVYDGTSDIITKLLSVCATVDSFSTYALLALNAESLRFNVGAMLDILKVLAPKEEDWYGWRGKDWQDPGRRRLSEAVFESQYSLARVVGVCLRRDPLITIDKLCTWLGEATMLAKQQSSGDSEATIGDFALGCLFYGRDFDLPGICGKVASKGIDIALPFLRTLTKTDEMAIVALCEGWLGNGDLEQIVGEICSSLAKSSSELIRSRTTILLVKLMSDAQSLHVRDAVAGVLADNETYREQAWIVIRDTYRQGRGSSNRVMQFMSDKGSEVLALLRERLETIRPFDWANSSDGAREIIIELGKGVGSLDQVRSAVEIFNEVLEPEAIPTLGQALENVFYRIDSATTRDSGIMMLCERLLAGPDCEAAARWLMYIAYPYKEHAASAGLRALFSDANISGEASIGIINLICKRVEHRGLEAFEWLDSYRGLYLQDEWEKRLLVNVFLNHDETLVSLVEKAWNSPLSPVSGLAKVYLAERGRGASSYESARTALELRSRL